MNTIYTTLKANQVEEIAKAFLKANERNATDQEMKEMLRMLEPEISNPPQK